MQITVDELIRYTDEERARWEQWLGENGAELLSMPIVGEGQATIAALIMHIFGPEMRYIERISERPLTEYRGRPSGTIPEVFGFGLESRKTLRDFVSGLKSEDWDRTVELNFGGGPFHPTIRRIVLHILIHEIRHWAQIARIMRERGFAPPGQHDLIWSDAVP